MSALEIAFLAQGWAPDPGGVETHARALALAMIARGHRVRVLCLDGRSEREPYTVARERDPEHGPGLELARMAYGYHDHRALADLVHNPRAERAVLDWLAAAPCHVLHVHHLTGFGAGVLERLRGAPLARVVSLHDYWLLCPRGQMLDHEGRAVAAPDPERCGRCLVATWPHLMPSGSGARRGPTGEIVASDAEAAAARTAFALAALGAAQALIVPSPAARAVFERAGVPRERLTVIEYGIDAAGIARDVRRERASRARAVESAFVLGFLGSVLPSKGPLELARAVLAADVPGLRLEIHGPEPSWHGDRSYVAALRELAAGDARIALRGPYPQAELARVLARLDAVAVPSLWEETYGLVAREARAAGLPILVSDRGGLSAAAIGAAPGSAVVAAGEPTAWIGALRRLAGSARAEADPSSARGLRSVEEMAGEIEALYREVALDERGECVESPPS